MGGIKAKALVTSIWDWEQWRPAGRNGAYVLEDAWTEHNLVTDEGLTHLLDVVFSGGAAKSAWYLALFNNDYTPAAGDTYQSPGFTESENYNEGSRPEWVEAGVTALGISNVANVASFTMNTGETIYGGALLSASTKGDAASGEVLYCESRFTSSRTVEDDDILKVTATLTAQDVV